MNGQVEFLGFALPDPQMAVVIGMDSAMPVQTHTFGWAVINALRDAGLTVRLHSAAPVSCYPGYPQLVFRSHEFRVDEIVGRAMGFVNVLGIKHLTRFVGCLFGSAGPAPSIRLIHGVHSPFLWFGVIDRHLQHVPFVVILTDPPGVVRATDGPVTTLLRKLDICLVRAALGRCDGVVALTSALAEDLAPDRPALIMEAIADGPPSTAQPTSSPSPHAIPTLLYAGGITAANGIDRLVSAVDRMTSEVRLTVLGTGDLSDRLRRLTADDCRIDGPRMITRAEVRAAYCSADLLIQPRPTTHPAAAHSFPSKLIEYMASGTPVLSTRLAGIPAEYEPYVYWIEDDSAPGIARAVDTVLTTPAAQRRAFGAAAAQFAQHRCGRARQGDRLAEFLAEISRGVRSPTAGRRRAWPGSSSPPVRDRSAPPNPGANQAEGGRGARARY